MASDDISKAIKDARIAALFAFSCVLLVGLLLLIDGNRNKVMLGHVEQARRILDEFKTAVNGTVRDAGIEPVAETAGASAVGGTADHGGGDGGESAAGVVAAPAAGAGESAAGGKVAAPVNGAGGRRAGLAGGPRGNG